MAKCIGSDENWQPKHEDIDKNLSDSLENNEIALIRHLDATFDPLLLDAANFYMKIRKSTCISELKFDFTELSLKLKQTLSSIYSKIHSIIALLQQKAPCDNAIESAKIHRCFIVISSSIIGNYGDPGKLQKLLQTVGRLCDIDQSVYHADQRKPLMCDESIMIHSLTMIWTAVISMMERFYGSARVILSTDGDEENEYLIERLFQRTYLTTIKTFLMDLTITSWHKFQLLVKYEDLIKGLTMSCPCHRRMYYGYTRKLIETSKKEITFTSKLLASVSQFDRQISMKTTNLRLYDVLPIEAPFIHTNKTELSYFIVWHMYCLTKACKKPEDIQLLNGQGVGRLLMESVEESWKLFVNPSRDGATAVNLSPHQEERFKLLYHMLSVYCEQMMDKDRETVCNLICKMYNYFIENWEKFGSHYIENSSMLISDELTVYQLFSKLKDDFMKQDDQNTTNEIVRAWDKIQNLCVK